MKTHISSRLFVCLFVCLCSSMSAWAVTISHQSNIYATRLSFPDGNTISDDRTISVRFYANAQSNGVWVYLDMNENGKFDDGDLEVYANPTLDVTADEGGNKYGYETVKCTIPESVEAGEYKWLVKLRGKEEHREWGKPFPIRDYENTDKRYLFREAMSVSVDRSYESDYFGYTYVSESHGGKTTGVKFSDGNTYTRTTSDGIYVFGPMMGTALSSSNNGAYTGGVKWTTESKTREKGPFRTSIDSDGWIYVCQTRPESETASENDGVMIWRMNPAKRADNFQKVLSKQDLVNAEATHNVSAGKLFPYRVLTMAVGKNEEGQKVLYAICGYVSESDYLITNSVLLCSFIINDASGNISLTYTGKYKKLYYDDGPQLRNTLCSILPGKYGDLWIFQNRGGADAKIPSVIHLDKDWNIDYTQPSSERLNVRGVGALSHDGSILAVPDFGVIYFYDVQYKNTSQIKSLTQKSYKLSDIPNLNDWTAAKQIDGMAFDVANNLHFIAGHQEGSNTTTHTLVDRLYVYALPKADNSHVTPAKSSLKIQVTDKICWHPYPDNYQMKNEELLEIFKHDYKERYSRDCNFTENAEDFQDMLTNANSPWKWLGDYFNKVGAQRRKIPTNAELWVDFKSYFNEYYVKEDYDNQTNKYPRDESTDITSVSTFWPSGIDSKADILTKNDSRYKWLGDYILNKAKEVPSNNVELWWRVQLHAFFNGIKYTLGGITSFDFTEAGKTTEWRAAYLAAMKAQGVNVAIVDDAIDLNSEWRVCAATFFGQMGIETSQGFITTKINNKRNASDEWYPLWRSSLPTTLQVQENNSLPYVVKNDYIFDGWYFGNDHNGTHPGYNIQTPAKVEIIKNGCVYARWLETTLHEGYVTDEQMIADHQSQYRNFNLDLINAITNQQYNLKLDRKIVGGMYNTMCLPFAIEGKSTFANIQYVDGGQPFASVDDFSLVYFDGTTPTDDVFVLDFMELGDNDRLPANTPFLLKPKTDITKLMRYGSAPVIQSVYNTGGEMPLSDGDGEDDQVLSGLGYGLTVGDEDEYFTFTGVLAPVSIPANSVLLVADNRLAVDPQGGTMMGMRGFFNMKLAAHNMPMALRITSKDNTTTYLDAVNMSTQTNNATKILVNGQIYILRDGRVYDIMGRSLSER